MVSARLLATAAAAAVTAGLFSASVHATTFGFAIVNSSNAILANGQVTTSNTLNTLGGYDVLSITGQVTGYGAITGLVPTSAPATATSGHGFIYNNVVYSNSALAMDYYGLLFTTGSPTTPAYWNIFHDAGTDWLYGNVPSIGYVPATGTATIAAVPEPGTWALALAGFALVGGALRRRRTPNVRVRLQFA